MFAQAAPPGSRLLRLSGSLGAVKAWATRAPDGSLRVALINEYTAQARTVAVRIPGVRATGTLERLQAPGLSARTGVTLGGQTFGTDKAAAPDGGALTTTGVLAGRSSVTRVSKTSRGYVVRMPAASAALLTLSGPPPA